MKFVRTVATAALVLASGAANSASLVLTLDQDTTVGNAAGTTLTLVFANYTDNDLNFVNADLVGRSWANLSSFGPQNLINVAGNYPQSNLSNAIPGVVGSVSFNSIAGQGQFDFGFTYTETSPSLGFTPISLAYVSGNRVRGPAMWTAIDGFFPNFYIDSATYSATGTPDNFAVTAVPEPETYAMLLAGLGVLGFMARRRKQTGAA